MEIVQNLGIHVVPIRVNIGRDSYRDGIDIDSAEFSRRIAGQEQPTTSQPPPHQFEALFESLLDQGHEVLCITLSSALSGTYHSASIAAQRFGSRVQVVDSLLVSAGLGLLAVRAARMALEDHSLPGVADFVQGEKKRIRIFATLDNVDSIVKGGRLNLFALHAADRSDIRLLFTRNNSGGVQILERVRGRRRSLDRLVELLGSDCVDVAIAHFGSPSEALLLAEQIRSQWGAKTTYIAEASSTVGTYAGRGAIIVAC
jgi:DegV family protein with EDD domain